MTARVTVADLVKNTKLQVYYGKHNLNRLISTSDISRPGIELTGYFNYYPSRRIQLFGITECSYAKGMKPQRRAEIMKRLCQPGTPAFVISTQLEPPKELVEAAKAKGIPILGSKLTTSRVLSNMSNFLEDKLSERKSVHGVLVEVYGLGVLITGKSGIGKSETALELVKRGHCLIADDRVDVFQRDEQTLVGEAPMILRHLLEIRGIGVINVMTLFGAGAVMSKAPVDMIVNLTPWSKNAIYDRLGNSGKAQQIFDVRVPEFNIPVRTGRNLSILIETAAMNFRAHCMGFDAMESFNHDQNKLIQQHTAEVKRTQDEEKRILQENHRAIAHYRKLHPKRS